MKTIKYLSIALLSVFLASMVLVSCKNKDPSVLKVFVRDENDELLPDAKVIIIGDTKSNPPTIDYVDTMFTDAQGVAEFNMDEFYETSGKDVTTGYFDLLVKTTLKQAKGRTRVKQHIVTVETVSIEP
jgi:hypothetical protein